MNEAEILSWLTLGHGTVEGRPLLRPVVHGFVRGISGAVVSFPEEESGPKLWLAAEDEIEAAGGEEKYAHFPVTTCTTCGQHYFFAFLKDFDFTGKAPGGGEAKGILPFGSLWRSPKGAGASSCLITWSEVQRTRTLNSMSARPPFISADIAPAHIQDP